MLWADPDVLVVSGKIVIVLQCAVKVQLPTAIIRLPAPETVQESSSIRSSHNHHFDYSATIVHYLCVSVPLAVRPSLIE